MLNLAKAPLLIFCCARKENWCHYNLSYHLSIFSWNAIYDWALKIEHYIQTISIDLEHYFYHVFRTRCHQKCSQFIQVVNWGSIPIYDTWKNTTVRIKHSYFAEHICFISYKNRLDMKTPNKNIHSTGLQAKGPIKNVRYQRPEVIPVFGGVNSNPGMNTPLKTV